MFPVLILVTEKYQGKDVQGEIGELTVHREDVVRDPGEEGQELVVREIPE